MGKLVTLLLMGCAPAFLLTTLHAHPCSEATVQNQRTAVSVQRRHTVLLCSDSVACLLPSEPSDGAIRSRASPLWP